MSDATKTEADLQGEQEDQDEKQAQKALQKNDVFQSTVRKNNEAKEFVPLWLITFTDVMALMLTFFVLLYSMSVPQQEKWEGITDALSSKFSQKFAKPYNAGVEPSINIDKIDQSRALDLSYLKALVKNLLKTKGIEGVVMFQNGSRLIISLPSELLFESGQSKINMDGKKVLFALGGALSRVRNRIEIVGHSDPNPIRGGVYSTNWELSLARGAAVASGLLDVGYEREVTVRGVSSARFEELSTETPEEERYNLSRRVDIILMEDSGLVQKFNTSRQR